MFRSKRQRNIINYAILNDPQKYFKPEITALTSLSSKKRSEKNKTSDEKKFFSFITQLNSEILQQFVKKRMFSISGKIEIDIGLYNNLLMRNVKKRLTENDNLFSLVEVRKLYDNHTDIWSLKLFKACVQRRNGFEYRINPFEECKKTKTKYYFRFTILKFGKKERLN
jgi:hypothetical protein